MAVMLICSFVTSSPKYKEGEEAAVNALGLGPLKKFIDEAYAKVLPGLGTIMKAMTGDLEGAKKCTQKSLRTEW